jgi:outer membrane protein OmpA-like peptidoglycan-associated protein
MSPTVTQAASRCFARRLVTLLPFLALAMLGMAAQVNAQGRFDVENFTPSADQEGSVLRLQGAQTLQQAAYSIGLFGSYERNPLTIRDNDGKRLGDLIGSVGTLTLLGTVGIYDRLDLGLAIPIHRVSAGSGFAIAPPRDVQAALISKSKAAFGDIELTPRFSLIERKNGGKVGLAVLVPLWLPTGDDSLYAGESFRAEPRLSVDADLSPVTLVGNVGYMVRKRVELLGRSLDDMLRWGAGANIVLVDKLSALIEFSGAFNVLTDHYRKYDAPSEGMLGLRWIHSGFLMQVGGGTGLVRGVGSPQYRLFASVGYAASPAPADLDPDRDGILGGADRCPTQAEDVDGFEDADGCPDLDNDQDGVPDAQDRCPNVAEDRDGFEDADGCPDLDNDHDGVPDADDHCPDQAEDKDGFQDEDGCPDLDNDQDGIPDADDHCPNEAGVAAQQGCPAPVTSNVQITGNKIELNQSVFFASNSAEILGQSLPLMDEIAKLLLDHAELQKVVVEGHSDNSGGHNHNLRLSKQRAESVVQALIKRGVAADRLRAEGYGPDRPLVPNDSDENRAKNRRVQLRIDQ